MERAPSPLAVAAAAACLLIVVVAVDLAFNRTYTLEAQRSDGTWETVAQTPQENWYERVQTEFEVNRSDEVAFRLVADNGHPWALSSDYTIEITGELVEQGTVTAPAMGQGTASFTIIGEELLGASPRSPSPVDGRYRHLGITVWIDSERIYGGLAVQEVSR